jgi:hypothetical protein
MSKEGWEIVGIAIAILGTVAGLMLWIINVTLAPLKQSIEACTKAIEKLTIAVERQDDKLEDQGNRLAVMETFHKSHHPGEL